MSKINTQIASKNSINVSLQSTLSQLVTYTEKICDITKNYQYGTPISTIPTSEPETAQCSWTVTSNMFPSYSLQPASVDSIGFILAGCSNTGGSSRTLNWRVKRNGTSIGTGSHSVPADNKATLNFNSLSGENKPVVNDVLEVYLWSSESGTDMTVDIQAFCIEPAKFKPVNDVNKLLFDVNFILSNTSTYNPIGFNSSYSKQYYLKKWSNRKNTYVTLYGGTFSFWFDSENSDYGIFTNLIDTNASNYVRVHLSNYLQDMVTKILQVKWTETNMAYGG